jgi:hypothetical protein
VGCQLSRIIVSRIDAFLHTESRTILYFVSFCISIYSKHWNVASVVTGTLVLDPTNTRTFCGVLGSRWMNNININLQVIWCKDMDWSHLAQDRIQWQAVGNIVMNVCVFFTITHNLLCSYIHYRITLSYMTC